MKKSMIILFYFASILLHGQGVIVGMFNNGTDTSYYQINFAPSGTREISGWHLLTDGSQGFIDTLYNSKGEESNITIENIKSAGVQSYLGHIGSGYPTVVDSTYHGSTWQDSIAYEFDNLDVSKYYNIDVFSSHANLSGRINHIVINSDTVTIDPIEDNEIIAVFQDITVAADSTVIVRIISGDASKDTFINGLVIKEY